MGLVWANFPSSRRLNQTLNQQIKLKRIVFKITTVSLFAAALLAAPMLAHAAEKTNAPAAAGQETSSKHKKHETVPFNGKLAAVDKVAMTITVGGRTFAITSATKITKDGLPATLADGVVGEMIGGAYRKEADGKLSAISLNLSKKSDGEKPAGAKKKKKQTAAADVGASTNSMPR